MSKKTKQESIYELEIRIRTGQEMVAYLKAQFERLGKLVEKDIQKLNSLKSEEE